MYIRLLNYIKKMKKETKKQVKKAKAKVTKEQDSSDEVVHTPKVGVEDVPIVEEVRAFRESIVRSAPLRGRALVMSKIK